MPTIKIGQDIHAFFQYPNIYQASIPNKAKSIFND